MSVSERLASPLSGAELGNGVRGDWSVAWGIGQDFDRSARDDVQRIARIAGTEQNLASREVPVLHARQQLLDPLCRQVAQEIAFRQQPDQLLCFFLLAFERVFTKARLVADGGALLLEKEGRRIVDDGPRGEAATYERPRRTRVEPEMVQLLCADESELDGERADQRPCREGEDAREHPLREGHIEANGDSQED